MIGAKRDGLCDLRDSAFRGASAELKGADLVCPGLNILPFTSLERLVKTQRKIGAGTIACGEAP